MTDHENPTTPPEAPSAPHSQPTSFDDLFGLPPTPPEAPPPAPEPPSPVEPEGLILEAFSNSLSEEFRISESLVTESAAEPLPEPIVAPEPAAAPEPPAVHLEPAPEPPTAPEPVDVAPPEPAPAVPQHLSGLRLQVAALSDIGCVRTNNEDSYGYDAAQGLYIVCDGMGGMASGEIASSMAVTTALGNFSASANSGLAVGTRLQEAIRAANAAVWDFGQQPEHRGMGTTLVAAAQEGDSLIIGNVGDSRAYMLKPGRCLQITIDHSYLNELIRNGTVALENAHNVDLKGMESVITRAIGAGAEVNPDFFAVQPHPGDLVLIASDGLTRYLTGDEILEVLSATEFSAGPQTLIAIAKRRGGVDNITVLLLRAL